MIDILTDRNGQIVLSIDTSIYDNWVIDKVLYWLTADYIITRRNNPETNIQVIS